MDANCEVVDLGIAVPDYFEGFGVSFTPFSDSVVGVGDSPREALEDALEQIGNSGDDTTDLEATIRQQYPRYYESAGSQTVEEITAEWDDDDDDDDDQSAKQYYVGIRYNSEVDIQDDDDDSKD